MTLVVLSGLSALLGASILAIALLTYWLRKTRADINRLHAELTATKIAALKTLSVAPSPREDPEPVRRKRHLALYIGGAVAAFFASVGDRLRSLVRGRRAAVVVAATSVLVAGSAAAYYASTDQAAPRPLAEPGASLVFPGSGGSGTQDPESGAPGGHHTDATTGTSATGDDSDPSGAHLTLPGLAGVTGDGHQGGTGHGGQGASGNGGQDRPGTPGKPSTPTPTPPGETKPPPPMPRPTPPPVPPTPPAPSEPPHTTPPPSDDTDLCVLPSMINLCVGSVIGVPLIRGS
ncbi:hypothetical protein [Streptomyces europaeiscabiei]|uniref:hypothetical protein n=1 Tax=Streptomyces europaeiscabiei TaxID=146819 RepID=UPI002E167076|nr:hypothetical protein OHB30_32930 [Streptomyces europaeiscabiei]